MSATTHLAVSASDSGKFPLGNIVATPNALQRIPKEHWLRGLAHHHQGDWGLVDEEDKQANDDALLQGSRLLSAYEADDGTRFWIITEADRSVTTILLPEDY